MQLICFVLSALLYQASVTEPPQKYLGFKTLGWESLQGCSLHLSNSGPFSVFHRLVTEDSRDKRLPSNCQSSWKSVTGNVLEYQYLVRGKSKKPQQQYIQVENFRGETVDQLLVQPTPDGNPWWRAHQIRLRGNEGKVRIHVVEKTDGHSSIELRNRLDFYERSSSFELLSLMQNEPIISQCLALLLSASVLLLLLSTSHHTLSTRSRWILFFGISVAVHFRFDSFFLLDEWELLSRIHEKGIAALFMAHNEHFVPLFVGMYMLEYYLFGMHYELFLLVSLMIHAANGVLLDRMLFSLFGQNDEKRQVTVLISALYLLNGLQVETLNWAICQSTLLSLTCMLCVLIVAAKYLSNGKQRQLLLVAVFTVLSVLFFGGAFILAALVPAYMWLVHSHLCQNAKLSFQRTVIASSIVVIILGSCGLLYYSFRMGSGHGFNHIILPSVAGFVLYTLYGAQFGTIFRGLGIYPYETPDPLMEMLRHFFPALLPTGFPVLLLGVLVGLLLSVGFFACYRLMRAKGAGGYTIMFFVVGQCFVLAPFALTALGRVERYGLAHSLAYRYTTISLMGLCLMIAPLLTGAMKALNVPQRKQSLGRRFGFSLFWGLLLWLTYNHIHSLQTNRFYPKTGHYFRSYLVQVNHWNSRLGRTHADSKVSYEGNGTKFHGIYPVLFFPFHQDVVAQATLVHPDTIAALFGIFAPDLVSRISSADTLSKTRQKSRPPHEH